MHIVAVCWIVSFGCFFFWQLNILTLQCLVSDWYPAKNALVSHVTIYGEMIFCMCIWFSKVLRKKLYFDVMWSHEEGKIFVIFSFPLLCLPLQLIKIQEDISLPQSQVANFIKELLWWYLDKLLLSCASVCGKLALLYKEMEWGITTV